MPQGPHLVDSDTRWGPALTFAAVATFVLVLALNGGSYDIVVRQQAGLVVWWLLLLGVVAGVIRGRTLPLDARLVLGGLGVLAVWTAISFGWTSSDERTLTEVARVVAHLGFVVAALLLIGPRTWPAAVAGVAFAMAAVTVLAFAGRFSEGLFGTSAVAVNFGALRLSEPLNYWNALGAWAGMTSALCLAWSAHATRTAVRGLSLAVVPVAIAVSYLTYSRASLGGTVLGIVVVLALSSHRWTLIVHSLAALTGGAAIVLALRGAPELADGVGNDGAAGVLVVAAAAVLVVAVVAAATGRAGLDRRHLGPVAARRFGVALAVCGLLGGAAGAVLVGPDAWRQFKEQGVPATSTDPAARLTNLNGSRYEVWATAVDVFGDHPVKGVGAGTFEYSWNAAQRDDEFLRDAHSLYLEVLAELGIVGFLALLTFLAGVVVAIARVARRVGSGPQRGVVAGAAGAASAFFFGASVDWLWESTAVAAVALVLVGALLASGTTARALGGSRRAGFALVAVLFVAVQLPGLVSTSEIRRSQDAVRAGDLDGARGHAIDAASAQPWASSPFVQRALVEEQAGDLTAAVSSLRLAEDREPQDWRIPLLLARVQARAGDAQDALASFRRARALRPQGKFFQP